MPLIHQIYHLRHSLFLHPYEIRAWNEGWESTNTYQEIVYWTGWSSKYYSSFLFGNCKKINLDREETCDFIYKQKKTVTFIPVSDTWLHWFSCKHYNHMQYHTTLLLQFIILPSSIVLRRPRTWIRSSPHARIVEHDSSEWTYFPGNIVLEKVSAKRRLTMKVEGKNSTLAVCTWCKEDIFSIFLC